MEHLNKVELQGTIWNAYIKDYGTTRAVTLLIVTQCSYYAQDGSPVIENTWHHVTAWEGEKIANLDLLTTGTDVHIVGRIRVRKRRKCIGEEITDRDIVASKVGLM